MVQPTRANAHSQPARRSSTRGGPFRTGTVGALPPMPGVPAATSPRALVTESRIDYLLRVGAARPRFLQGVFPFVGAGYFSPVLLNHELRYVVPASRTARLAYVRAGNLADEPIYLSILCDGAAMRYFPIRAGGDVHVALAIMKSIPGGSELEVHVAAPDDLAGAVVLDVGFLEVAADDIPDVAPFPVGTQAAAPASGDAEGA